MSGKGGSPMLCTLSSFCSAELPYREEDDEEADQEEEEDQKRRRRMGRSGA